MVGIELTQALSGALGIGAHILLPNYCPHVWSVLVLSIAGVGVLLIWGVSFQLSSVIGLHNVRGAC